MIISTKRFWDEVKAGALRPADPPSWVAENLRTRVSIGLRHVPGSPGHLPRREDHPGEQEESQ